MQSSLPSVVTFAAELQTWPEFHNGVAAGLRLLSPQNNNSDNIDGNNDNNNNSSSSGQQMRLARTWVVYNRHCEPSYSHAGLLMALGLNGHLNVSISLMQIIY